MQTSFNRESRDYNYYLEVKVQKTSQPIIKPTPEIVDPFKIIDISNIVQPKYYFRLVQLHVLHDELVRYKYIFEYTEENNNIKNYRFFLFWSESSFVLKENMLLSFEFIKKAGVGEGETQTQARNIKYTGPGSTLKITYARTQKSAIYRLLISIVKPQIAR